MTRKLRKRGDISHELYTTLALIVSNKEDFNYSLRSINGFMMCQGFYIENISSFLEYHHKPLAQNVKGAATDIRYFARSKLSRSIVHKKNFNFI